MSKAIAPLASGLSGLDTFEIHIFCEQGAGGGRDARFIGAFKNTITQRRKGAEACTLAAWRLCEKSVKW